MVSKIKIFIVEDEAIIAENTRITLEDLGYEVVQVSYSYHEAIANIASCTFDVLLLDINLGNQETEAGLDIAAKLPQIKAVPFIFLTAFSDTDTIVKASKLKPSAYLVKPASAATLFAAIQTAIENFSIKRDAALPGETSAELDHFYCKSGVKLVKVYWADVYALVAVKNYVKLLTPDNSSGFLIRGSLQQVFNKIVPLSLQKNYIPISRSSYLHRDAILERRPGYVITRHGEFEASRNLAADDSLQR